MTIPRTLCALALLALTGCLPSTTLDRVEALDRVAEGEVDRLVEFNVRRLCSAPTDVLARQAAKSRDIAAGMYLICGPVRSLVDSVNLAIGR